MYPIFNRVKFGNVRMKVRRENENTCEVIERFFMIVDNQILNGLDDESHLLEKSRPTTSEVDWSHVPTKRKKPAKRKVCCSLSLRLRLLLHHQFYHRCRTRKSSRYNSSKKNNKNKNSNKKNQYKKRKQK